MISSWNRSMMDRFPVRRDDLMDDSKRVSAETAVRFLLNGNREYAETGRMNGDYSEARRIDTEENGQHPYAVVLTCSDSRVVPEAIFSAGNGDLFVIRTAGNTIDEGTLGSIEYAVEHLGCNLVVVLGHTHCGAVDAALHEHKGLKVTAILDKISDAAGDEKDPLRVTELNAIASAKIVCEDLIMDEGVVVKAAVYDIRTGLVRFIRY